MQLIVAERENCGLYNIWNASHSAAGLHHAAPPTPRRRPLRFSKAPRPEIANRKGTATRAVPSLFCADDLLYGFQVTWIVIFASAVSVTHANAPEQTVELGRSDLMHDR